jgi:hypothetical protein
VVIGSHTEAGPGRGLTHVQWIALWASSEEFVVEWSTKEQDHALPMNQNAVHIWRLRFCLENVRTAKFTWAGCAKEAPV